MTFIKVSAMGLLLMSGICQAAVVDSQTNQCPTQKLHRQVEKDQRVTINFQIDDPVYLSKHYCFAHVTNDEIANKNQLPTVIKDTEAFAMTGRYNASYKSLSRDEQKVAFAHLFLKTLSQKMMVIPQRDSRQKLHILLPTNGGTRVILVRQNLAVTDADYSLIRDGLLELVDKPAIDQDWPELVKLVGRVIENKSSKGDQTVGLMLYR
ncbi:MAG: hypothetical protein MJK04_33895 [Psychrosphaera sp.]|nr:hypothetical protein [Psychrosphaera sp.]